MAGKDRVLAALPSLTKAELREVSKVLEALIGDSAADPLGEHWFNAFMDVLGSRKKYSVIKRSTAGKGLREHAGNAEEFMRAVAKPRTDTQAMAARKLLVFLLLDDLKRRKVEPSLGILAVNLGRLADVFDLAFPDYRSSGLTSLIFNYAGRQK